jgi:hypothetical protein
MASIQDVYLRFDPMEALEPGDERYVDCFDVRGIPTLYAQMLLPLAAPKPTAQLLSGHLGDGKTTLLKHLQKRFEDDGHFVAYGEADHWLDLADLGHEDLLLGLLVTVDEALHCRYRKDCEAGAFQQVWERMYNIAHMPVDVKAGLAGLTAALRDVPDLRIQVRNELRTARGPSFLDVVNEYLDRGRELVEKRGHKSLVVVLDNLDRVPESVGHDHVFADEKLFLGQAAQLTRLHCHTIYVVRLALAHTQEGNLRERYGRSPQVIPMLSLRRRDGSEDVEGLTKLREILEARLRPLDLALTDAFDDDARDLLCRKSGGHLRELMSLVQRACAEALGTHGELPLRASDATAAVRDHGDLRRQASRDHYDALCSVDDIHALDGLDAEERAALLNKRLVYEYRDDDGYWYDVAPLCEED